MVCDGDPGTVLSLLTFLRALANKQPIDTTTGASLHVLVIHLLNTTLQPTERATSPLSFR